MDAYISSDLNMVKELDPMRHELALLQADWLEKGGTIEVLAGPSFQPPPKRHEPLPKKKPMAKVEKVKTTAFVDRMERQELERECRAAERAAERARLVDRIRALAETLNYSQAIMVTGMSRKVLYALAKEGGFSFQPSGYTGRKNLRRATVDEAKDAKNAERIKAFKELGLTRNQTMEKVGISFTAFTRIITKFGIDYPKTGRGGPRSAFFPRGKESSK